MSKWWAFDWYLLDLTRQLCDYCIQVQTVDRIELKCQIELNWNVPATLTTTNAACDLCLSPLSSCLPHTDGMPGRHNGEVWDLGHGRTGALPQSRPHVLQGRPGCHRGLRHHQYSESGLLHLPVSIAPMTGWSVQCNVNVVRLVWDSLRPC